MSRNNFDDYRNRLIAGAEFTVTERMIHANALYSENTVYGVLISIDLIFNAILKKLFGDSHSISLSLEQLPDDETNYEDSHVSPTILKTIFFMGFYMASIAYYVVHPLKESLSKVKQLQYMSLGVSSLTYWGTMFFVDLVIALVSLILITASFLCVDSFFDEKIYNFTEIS